jgi:hypothetical protein
VAGDRMITLTAESYAVAVGNLLALRQLASELADVLIALDYESG